LQTAATINPALYLGFGNDLAKIAKGKLVDIVMPDADRFWTSATQKKETSRLPMADYCIA
jgi:imidazolonepropionase-like amidohydrolase